MFHFAAMSEIRFERGFAPRSLHDVALRGWPVQLACRQCTHRAIFDPYALWWLFERRRWSDRLGIVSRRFYCTRCGHRLPQLAVVDDPPTDTTLHRPPQDVWRASVKRRRT